ncbi:hypothetical protein [Trujillonella endophytica]|uniref:Uncharacterized protein n=1 Tax=Trujillonella endophytica TaxID=673521 RepID=A0A1H8U1G8_9ACTN|nr:hypothetical protein [Trujillella endophytica]SEO97011.1 hypothetical protein SAMN05660991_02612 [Trujillella endophytica]
MNTGILLLVLGGFLIGGAWSTWRADPGPQGRSGPQVGFAGILLIAAVLATASGILRLV